MGRGSYQKRRNKFTIVKNFPVILSALSLLGFGYYLLVYNGDLSIHNVFRSKEAALTADLLKRVVIKTDQYTNKAMDATSEDFDITGNTRFEYPPVLSDPYKYLDYPNFDSLLNVIKKWNPDTPEPPAVFKETLIHFNYSDPVERGYAEKFRDAELPFKVYNIPEFTAASQLWSDDYLESQFFGDAHGKHIEKSKNNHFMYWNGMPRSWEIAV